MSYARMIVMVLIMAVVTYAIRMIPMTFFKKKITSQYIRSLFFYLPFAVLSAMTFPFIFYSTGNIYTAICGTLVALSLALAKRSLIVVSLSACAVVCLLNYVLPLIF